MITAGSSFVPTFLRPRPLGLISGLWKPRFVALACLYAIMSTPCGYSALSNTGTPSGRSSTSGQTRPTHSGNSCSKAWGWRSLMPSPRRLIARSNVPIVGSRTASSGHPLWKNSPPSKKFARSSSKRSIATIIFRFTQPPARSPIIASPRPERQAGIFSDRSFFLNRTDQPRTCSV